MMNTQMKSFKVEVIANHFSVWSSSALRFATAPETKLYAKDLASRWPAVREFRVVESTDDVNSQWAEGKLLRKEPVR